MARRTLGHARRSKDEDRRGTREHLLEAAGEVFAEKGFSGATAKEISERAKTNSAAVNYYFGGIEPLYAAVLEEAQNRVLSVQAIEKAIEGITDPKKRFEAIVGVVVQTLLGPVSSSWVLRVIARDMVTPSPTRDAVKERVILPRARLLRQFLGNLLRLPEDDPAVARACVTLMAPLFLLVLGDRRMLKRALPSLGLDADDASALARHITRYALAGLQATGQDARKRR